MPAITARPANVRPGPAAEVLTQTMSADNYYLIAADAGRFVASMGFRSDGRDPDPHPTDHRFDTLAEAEDWAREQDSEYGVEVAESARLLDAAKSMPGTVNTVHFPASPNGWICTGYDYRPTEPGVFKVTITYRPTAPA